MSFIKEKCKIDVDSDYKIRMRFLNLVGYGYDFEKKETAEEFYRNAVEKTKKMAGIPGIEEFISEGIKENFGWYITKI